MRWEIIGDIRDSETIARGARLKARRRLRKRYGAGRWRKCKGVATVPSRMERSDKQRYIGTRQAGLGGRNSRSSACSATSHEIYRHETPIRHLRRQRGLPRVTRALEGVPCAPRPR